MPVSFQIFRGCKIAIISTIVRSGTHIFQILLMEANSGRWFHLSIRIARIKWAFLRLGVVLGIYSLELARLGYDVTAIDMSEQSINFANKPYQRPQKSKILALLSISYHQFVNSKRSFWSNLLSRCPPLPSEWRWIWVSLLLPIT